MGAKGVVLNDLDNDGYLDIVFANWYYVSLGSIDSYIYWGSSTGYSTSDRTSLLTDAAKDADTVDLDDDGFIDIVFQV